MRIVIPLALTWVVASAVAYAPSSAQAQDAVMVGKNPTECEVAAALGVNKAGCPPLPHPPAESKPLGVRGLTIGTVERMPDPPPPPVESPAAAAAPPPAAPAAARPPQPAAPAVPAATPAAAQVPAPAPVRKQYTAAFQINFEFGSARLTPDARQILDLVGAAITAPDAAASSFRIVGHTDAVGPRQSNQHLSEIRADAVRDYLINRHSIAPGRLQAFGRGSSDLLNRSNPKAPENRRVEITNLGS